MDRGRLTIGLAVVCVCCGAAAWCSAQPASGASSGSTTAGDAAHRLVVPPEPAAPGKVVEMWVDRTSGVTSAWLSNGILVHHRLMKVAADPPPADAKEPAGERQRDRAAPEVAVCVTLAGAELLETADNRGMSDAAVAAAWNVLSVKSMKPGELGAFVEASGTSVRCFGGADSFIITATSKADQAAAAMNGVRLLLCEPRVDADELGKWKDKSIKSIEDRSGAGGEAFAGVIGALFGPQEARARRPEAKNIRAITPEQAQQWIDRAVGAGGNDAAKAMPMEVAIVGDIPVDRAMRLAAAYFGSLPERDRITEQTLAERRAATHAQKPPAELTVEAWKGSPLVLLGFFGADIKEIGDHRALAIGARILTQRLKRLPKEQNDGDNGVVMEMPASVYPGFGLFLAMTHTKDGAEAGASENIQKLLDDLIEKGPTKEEMTSAAHDLGKGAERALGDPVYWARTLSRSAYHGFAVSQIGRAGREYEEMPSEVVVRTLKKYCTPERSIKLIVKPGAGKPREQ